MDTAVHSHLTGRSLLCYTLLLRSLASTASHPVVSVSINASHDIHVYIVYILMHTAHTSAVMCVCWQSNEARSHWGCLAHQA